MTNWKKHWKKQFDKEFVKGYGGGLVDWTYPEEEDIKDFIQDLLDEQIAEIWDMIFDSYPKDMENFDTMTEDQAYRLLKTFRNKLEKLDKELKSLS